MLLLLEFRTHRASAIVYSTSASPTTRMSETIYSLVPHVPEVPVKPPMYKSRHDPVCVLAGSTFGEGKRGKRNVKDKEKEVVKHPAQSRATKAFPARPGKLCYIATVCCLQQIACVRICFGACYHDSCSFLGEKTNGMCSPLTLSLREA